MLENKEMVYTAIYQNSIGELSYDVYKGHMDRCSAWLEAAKIGGANDLCLIALVPGVHPVYFYSNFVDSLATKQENNDDVKNHDLFDMN